VQSDIRADTLLNSLLTALYEDVDLCLNIAEISKAFLEILWIQIPCKHAHKFYAIMICISEGIL